MQKLQDSVFSIVKTTNLSPAVFSYLQPTVDFPDKSPQGGILRDTKHGWLALGPKFCVINLSTGMKVAARTFGAALSNYRTTVTSVVELSTPLTINSQQLLISLECEDIAGMICVFHINGSQILRCIKTDVVVTQLAVCDGIPDGYFTCFDGMVMAGTKSGEIFVFDLNRSSLIQALKDSSQGYEQMIHGEENTARMTFLPLHAVQQIEDQRDLALENDEHIAVLLNENSLIDGQYIFRNPDGTVRMKAKRDHIRVTVLEYIPQLGSLAVGFNFGAFQLWNLLNLDLEFTSQVNIECLPVTHFGFQEPCDDPRAFCYLWVVFSVIDRFEEEEFPLAVMYSLTYQGKRMLSDTKCLYQDFNAATVRFQVDLRAPDGNTQLIGGRCISCHSYSIDSTVGEEGEDSMLNICQLVWECWGETANSSAQHGMLLFDLDQWYKDQMPATYQLQSNAFMSATWCSWQVGAVPLAARLAPASVAGYVAPNRLEEHFYPNSLHYDCICLNTSESCVLNTIGIQRQIIKSMEEVGPTALLNPTRLYNACLETGLVPLYVDSNKIAKQEEQRRYLLSVALEARLSRFLKRCAHDWATGSHVGAGCTLDFLIDWCWKRAVELKENAKELTAPLFISSAMPDRNLIRCLEHCVQQLAQLTGLLDAVLTKCCNLVVPDALSEMEEKYKGIGTVSLYFRVVQWFLRCGLLPERHESSVDTTLPYPATHLTHTYTKRRLKLQRLEDNELGDQNPSKSCALLYIDQLIEHEFGGNRIHQMWLRGGSESKGLYPPPSLYSLLRLYLLPDIAEEQKHSLVLYLLVDYSMVYDEVRYEAVIRRLMQFPTMFGLSNTAIKATQAFWHLDHRDFDFALDQLQCLTGNTLSDWQHKVVLSSLLAQKKTQSALQYLHVRKPAPIQRKDDPNVTRVDTDKLDDWQSCCNLYLARGLVFEALDVVRMCVNNARCFEDGVQVLEFFFKGCRNTGHLSKILQASLLPFEEEVFIRYLEQCDESQTSDILIMYYLQQARYIEAQQYNNKLRNAKPKAKELSTSIESLADIMDRETARDALVDVVCSSLPTITNTVASCMLGRDMDTFLSNIIAPKPMSVFIQANSSKNTFTYKSSFVKNTIENASETWINKPQIRRGIKRALNVQETPFICTPKLSKTQSIFTTLDNSDTTPQKRPRLNLSGTPKTPKSSSAVKLNDKLNAELSVLLDMPEQQSPDTRLYDRGGAETPHSILKTRSMEGTMREPVSPVDSRYFDESDDELLETASNNTHYSDSTNKHLRFTIPTASESGSTPSPVSVPVRASESERSTVIRGNKKDLSVYSTSVSHAMDINPLESPPKKIAIDDDSKLRKTYKDSVRARRSLSISANSSLSEDPNTSMESIADIPITLINPRYSGEMKRHSEPSLREMEHTETAERKGDDTLVEGPKTPRGRRGIRARLNECTPVIIRSRSVTPERMDSPVKNTPRLRSTRSRSKTPEISPRSSPLEVIMEQPKQESESESHPLKTTLSIPRQLRSRSRTPERIEKVLESPKLEAITESPKSSDSAASSPTIRNLRSRSRTPDVEITEGQSTVENQPRNLRSRSKTPEKLISPKKEAPRSSKKSLSRIVLEANAFKTKHIEKSEMELNETKKSVIECTPMKSLKQLPGLMDVTISPIVNKSLLQSSNDSMLSESVKDQNKTVDDSVINLGVKPLPAFTMNETRFGKSVLNSCESSVESIQKDTSKDVKNEENTSKMKSIPAYTLNESMFEKSVLHSYQSSLGESSGVQDESITRDESKFVLKPSPANTNLNITEFIDSVLGSCDTSKAASSLMTSDSDVEMKNWGSEKGKQDTALMIQKEKEHINDIEREINEIEGMNDSDDEDDSDDGMAIDTGESTEYSSEEVDVSEEHSLHGDDVISIDDSESDSSNKNSSEPKVQTVFQEQVNKTAQVNLDAEFIEQNKEDKLVEDATESTIDPLNQANYSLFTNDSSVKSDQSVYKKEGVVQDVSTTTDFQPAEITIEVAVEQIDVENDISTNPSQIELEVGKQDKIDKIIQSKEETKSVKISTDDVDNAKPGTKSSEPTNLIANDKEKTAKKTNVEADKSKRLRKRQSSSSTKSDDSKVEIKTPTRKHTQSNASNKSVQKETPDVSPARKDTASSSRARSKTPIIERKILTRRASKELGRDVETSMEDVTPGRRTTRSRSKNVDDDAASIVSGSSVRSTRSRASEDPTDKPQIRKGRKSAVIKPDLSVIPEVTAEESSKMESSSDVINEYASSRRITRHQKSLLESWLEPKPSPSARRVSGSSRVSAISEQDEEDDNSSTHSHFDRISLMNKGDFQGSPDISELGDINTSPLESIASDASKQRRLRIGRAASESRSTPKAAKIGRRVSVDIVRTPEVGSPVVDSPSRSRRASFNRACEAILTPKGRRTSTDLRKGDPDSLQSSPSASEFDASATPSRRTRRSSSNSVASQSKLEAGKRTK